MKEKNREVQLRRYMRYDYGHVGETEGKQDSGGEGRGGEEKVPRKTIQIFLFRSGLQGRILLRPSLSDKLVLAERER